MMSFDLKGTRYQNVVCELKTAVKLQLLTATGRTLGAHPCFSAANYIDPSSSSNRTFLLHPPIVLSATKIHNMQCFWLQHKIRTKISVSFLPRDTTLLPDLFTITNTQIPILFLFCAYSQWLLLDPSELYFVSRCIPIRTVGSNHYATIRS